MCDKVRNDYGCSLEHVADKWRKAKFKLFGHVLPASPRDPLTLDQITFKTDELTPRAPTRRRPGRQEQDWTTEAYKDAYGIRHGDANAFDDNNIQHP